MSSTEDTADAVRERLLAEVAALHHDGVSALFDFGAQPDLRNASMVMAAFDQGGLGLPDRDYYLDDTAELAETRKAYRAHIERMFRLAGWPDAGAARFRLRHDLFTRLSVCSMAFAT